MNIEGVQRLAAYTQNVEIDRADRADRLGRARATHSATPPPRAAESDGFRLSLSSAGQRLAQPTDAGSAPRDEVAATPAPSTASTSAADPRAPEIGAPAPRSNRSLAIEAYQRNAAPASGERIRLRA